MNKLISIKEREGSISKLKNLLDSRKVHGVSYTNNYFNKRYLCRSSVLDKDVSIENGQVKLTIAARVEASGMWEIEETLKMLLKFEAGAMPGFSPDWMFENGEERKHLEFASPTEVMTTVDIMLDMKDPQIAYKDFSIAGSKFTLVEVHQELDEEFTQTITLLFGESDKMYLLSHFYDKDLNARDAKMILDLIVDENLTGKLVRSVMLEIPNGASSAVFPFERAIASYLGDDNEYVFGDGSGVLTISIDNLNDYKMTCEPNGTDGSYMIYLEGKGHSIAFMLE